MGVNCCAMLNSKADWRNVGLVASILLGDKPRKDFFRSDPKAGWSAKSEKFNYGATAPTHTPEYVDILVQADPENPAAKSIAQSDSLPYPMWYGLERKTLYPKATAAKIALTVAITKFFGGTVEYNDSLGKKRTYPTPSYIGAGDGKPWYQLQQAILDVKPLTQKDIDRAAKYAAY